MFALALFLLAAPPGPAAPGASPSGKELPEAQPISLHAALDHPEITLGQTFALVVDVVHDPADTYALPPDLATALGKGSLVLRGEPQIVRSEDPKGAHTQLTIPLADVASMKPSLPALELDVQGPSGERKVHLPEQAIAVKSLVAAEGEPNAEHAHHGPKPPEEIRVRSYLWVVLLLVLAAVAAGIYFFRKHRARKVAEAELPPPPEAPESEAVRRIRELRARAPWNRGAGRAAIFELSEIVRTYLGKQLGFNAIDLTSEELILAMSQHTFPGFDLLLFAERLRWEDLVKFAKLEPSPGECMQALDSAQQLVELTLAKLQAERHADLAAEKAAEKTATSKTAAARPPSIPTAGPAR